MKPDILDIIDITNLRKIVGLTIAEFDAELKQLGNSAIKKLTLSGIHFSRIRKSDDYIKQTISAYIRANYRYTEPNIANENRQIFEENKNFMSCTTEYTSEYKEVYQVDKIIYLLQNKVEKNSMGDVINKVEEVMRFAEIKSIGQRQSYQAAAVGLKPEFTCIIWKFEYNDEEYLKYQGKQYKITRTYIRDDEKIELTCSSQVNNEGDMYGNT